MLRHRRTPSHKCPVARRRPPTRFVEDEEPDDWIVEGPGEDEQSNANARA
jgi:hypothetical protein